VARLRREALSFAQGGDSPVLIIGPIGSGKTLLARYIQVHSVRATGPLQMVDCGAVSELDNVLFGHRRGSFTGAAHDAKGRLKQADGGVIVLDDVERLSHHHQDQLHRVLVDGAYYPVGADDPVHVDVRFIATTNKDPYEAAEHGSLKRDFLSRLDYFVLRVPALEDRLEDIPVLCVELLRRNLETQAAKGIQAAREMSFDPDCWPVIQARRFEDHVRGLEKLVARLITQVGERDVIVPADINAVWPQAASRAADKCSRTLRGVREDAERLHIAVVWKSDGFNVARTAHDLGITPRSLQMKLKRYGMTRPVG
jgi:DNA-binding NtrC family response regulator